MTSKDENLYSPFWKHASCDSWKICCIRTSHDEVFFRGRYRIRCVNMTRRIWSQFENMLQITWARCLKKIKTRTVKSSSTEKWMKYYILQLCYNEKKFLDFLYQIEFCLEKFWAIFGYFANQKKSFINVSWSLGT